MLPSRSFLKPNKTLRSRRRFVRSALQHLGSMGKPMKVTAEGRTFYICCDGCEEDVKTKGKEIVAKLDKLKGGQLTALFARLIEQKRPPRDDVSPGPLVF